MPTDTPNKKLKDAQHALTIRLPDTRGVIISRWGTGNEKLGTDGVYTYSRLPGSPDGRFAAASYKAGFAPNTSIGTCPGSTEACETICYAKRVVNTAVWDVWKRNSDSETLPWEDDPLPADAKIVRIHVSGDFTTQSYIEAWIALATRRSEVLFFGYTRSWNVPQLLPGLERFRALPNVQLFASMDGDMELPPEGWRRAWLEDDIRAISGGGPGDEQGLEFFLGEGIHNFKAVDGEPVYVCPEETGRKPNCQACGYCIRGTSGDVVFLVHSGDTKNT